MLIARAASVLSDYARIIAKADRGCMLAGLEPSVVHLASPALVSGSWGCVLAGLEPRVECLVSGP